MDRDWMKDIRECDGCHTEQYALPRYIRGTGLFLGFFCDRCEAERDADAGGDMIDTIRLCDVTLCCEDASVTVEDGYCFCTLHAQWYQDYVASGRPRDVRAWLHETHPETKP